MAIISLKKHLKLDPKTQKVLTFYSKIAKNIYNIGIYNLRQYYYDYKKVMRKYELEQIIFKNENCNYLAKEIVKETIDMLYTGFINYTKGIGNWMRYKPKDIGTSLRWKNVIKVKENNRSFIKVPIAPVRSKPKNANDELLNQFFDDLGYDQIPEVKIPVPKELQDKRIFTVIMKPQDFIEDYSIAYSYYRTSLPKITSKPKRFVVIDLGITNLATCVTIDNESFIIDGKNLKSINQLFNKKRAYFQSHLSHDMHSSNRLKYLYLSRNNKVESYLNNAVAMLFNMLKERNIDTIIIGKCDGFKTTGFTKTKGRSKTSVKKANQTFLQIPLLRFFEKIKIKADALGYHCFTTDETYTSQASFYDNDPFIPEYFSGSRILRGLYQTKDKYLVNADVNGALNILRRYIAETKTFDKIIIADLQKNITVPKRMYVPLE